MSAPERAGWPVSPFLTILAGACLILASPWISGAVTIPWDAKAHFYPQLVFLARALHAGESPFWAPQIFAGHPQIADPQSLIFSPPFLALAALDPAPSMRAMDATLYATLVLGAAALALLARERGLGPAAAMLAALAFAFGGSAAWRVQHVGQALSLAYLPIVLLCLERTVQARGWGGALGFGLAAGIAGAALVLGRDQVAFLGALIALGYALARLATRWRGGGAAPLRAIAGVVFAGAVGLTLAAVPLILTALLAADSTRVAIDLQGAGRGSLHPAYLLTLLTPDLFGVTAPLAQTWGPPSPLWGPVDLYLARNMGVLYLGVLPLIAAIAFVIGGRPRGIGLVFALIALATCLYALGRYTPLFALLFERLPGVALFRRPADATFLIGPALALVAAAGFERAGRMPQGPRVLAAIAAAILAGLIAAALLAWSKGRLAFAAPALGEATLWLLTGGIAFTALARIAPSRPWLATILVAAAMTADLARNNGPNESTALPTTLFAALDPGGNDPTATTLGRELSARAAPDRRDRVELAGLGFHWPNASLVHGFDHTLGYNPVRGRLFSAATGAGDHVALPNQRVFASAMPGYVSPLANLLGLRLIATGAPIHEIDGGLEPGQLPLVARTPEAFIHENVNALPRVLFVGEAKRFDPQLVLERGEWPETDFRRVVLIETEPPIAADPYPPPDGVGSARILAYANTIVEIEVVAWRDGYLVLQDMHHQWWRATVDGAPAPILRANLLFRAVPVREGRRIVRFSFHPVSGAWEEIRSRLTSAGAGPRREAPPR